MAPSGGLSSGVRVRVGTRHRFSRPTAILKVNKSAAQLSKEKKRRDNQLAALSFAEREQLFDVEMGDADFNEENAWEDYDDDEGLRTLPPGEEGFLQSHAGGEAIFHQILNDIDPKKRGDQRTRQDRIQLTINAWRKQIPDLVRAYFAWKFEDPVVVDTTQDGVWSILTLSINKREIRSFSHLPSAKNTNETLVRHGFLGCSPEKPHIAVSLELLRVYRQLHRVCPRLSIEAFAKALNHLHSVPQHLYLADQLSNAYDCYLEICRSVDSEVLIALKRDPKTWPMQNVCAPCLYKTELEPPLKFSFLATMDGNNSLKLFDGTFLAGKQRADDRVSASPRWLRVEEVDVFKDEVANSQQKKKSDQNSVEGPVVPEPNSQGTAMTDNADRPGTSDTVDGDVAWLNVVEQDELTEGVTVCVERWRNAGPEARKKMFALFAISGIFIAVCRHGHVLAMCDMVRSGELMKYPLAIVNRLLDQFGADIGLGYDIWCEFVKTLRKSSIGQRMITLRLEGVVPAFHGHAHNRLCQLAWHPMYTKGVGIEDFEECERTFAKSNELARGTRLATPFHRYQQIDEHFFFHDLDKYAAYGNFIYQNYLQALDTIRIDGGNLAILSANLGTTSADYEAYLISEREHLQGLMTEPPEVVQTTNYMEHLIKLDERYQASEQAKKDYQTLDYNIIHGGYTRKQISQVRTRYRTTYTRWVTYNDEVCRLEEEMGIETRWTPASKEYIDALSMLSERKYRQALDHLERLYVQRLFELTKLGLGGVGYKLREKISKALKTRADAIKHALDDYNEAASRLNPPRERLTWTKLNEVVTLAEFDLLRDTRQDIRNLPWANAARREAMNIYFRVKAAKDELPRLNVEIRRLLTFMVDDHVDYYRAIASNIIPNPTIALELSQRWELRSQIDAQIAKRLLETSRLKGFTGSLLPGTRAGRDPAINQGIPLPPWAKHILGIVQVSVEVEEAPDVVENVVDRVVDVDTDLVIQLMECL